jgi:hypothetical protein
MFGTRNTIALDHASMPTAESVRHAAHDEAICGEFCDRLDQVRKEIK